MLEIKKNFPKIAIIFLVFLMLFLAGCKKEQESETLEEKESFLEEATSMLSVPERADEDLDFPLEIIYQEKTISLNWITDSSAIDSLGKVTHLDEEVVVLVKVDATYNDVTITKEVGKVLVLSSDEVLFKEVYDNLSVMDEVSGDIDLPTDVNGVKIQWSSSDSRVLTNKGIYSYTPVDKIVVLEALVIYKDFLEAKEFEVKVLTYPDDKKIELALEEIVIPEVITSSLDLKEEYAYETKAVWSSSNEEVISKDGTVRLTYSEEEVFLTLTLTSNEVSINKIYKVRTKKMEKTEMQLDNHILVDRAKDFNEENMENVMLEDGKLVLKDGYTEGVYTSLIFNTRKFYELVASWAAITSTTSTCELEVQVLTDSTWSTYFTYGKWGLGQENLYYDKSDTKVYLSTDEIKLRNNYRGDAFRYRITLRRDTASVDSPKLSLVAVTLNIENYKYEVDTTNLESFVDYDVPRLNQNIVPVIGNSICSATTSTMLLKFKGLDFSDKDEFEHRYVASLVADRGHNNPTYGNWVYNTVTIGAFGFDSYVQRMYSWDELKYHLATVGPVGASIRGNTGVYTTNGHLILVRGYKEENGKTLVICNDPNISSVYYEFPLETFMGFWRGVAYIVE